MSETAEKKSDPRTVHLKRVRLSFSDSLKDMKATVENGPLKYGVNLIIESTGPHAEANKAKAMAAIKAACEEKWKDPNAFVAIQEDTPLRVCLRKGERFKNKKTGDVYKGYEGNLGLSCSTPGGGQRRPILFDRQKRPVEEKDILDVMYGGSFCDAVISVYGTEKGGRGVFCTVEIIRSHQEGEHLGRSINTSDFEFDDLEDDDAFGGDNDDMLG